MKIETNTPGLKDLDTVKLVTALDIYKPNGYESSMTPTTPRQTPSADSSMEGGGIKHDNIGIHQPPPISIKIINNGNDFSSDNDTQPNNVIQNGDPNSMDNDVVSFNPPIEHEVIKPDIEPTNTSKSGKSGKLDFDNLVVRKL